MIHIDVAFTNQRGASSILDLAVHNIKRDKIDLFVTFFREHILNRFNNDRENANITEILFDFILQFYITLLTPILESEYAGMLDSPIRSIEALHSLNLIGDVIPEREREEGEELPEGEGGEGDGETRINHLIDLATVIDLNIDLNANITQQENVDESFRTWFRDGADIIFVFLYDNGHEYDYIELSSEGSDQQLLEAFEKAGVLTE